MTKVPKRLEIVWTDAVTDDGSPEDSLMTCWEVGYLVKVTPKYVEIAREWGPETETGEFRFHMKIPRGMITEIRVLSRGRKIEL